MPIVGGHILLTEPAPEGSATWDDIPLEWSLIRFDAIDVLYITPFIVRPDLSFGLDPDGTHDARLSWIVRYARFLNPKIKLIAMQWYVSDKPQSIQGTLKVLETPQMIETYTDSVATFLHMWSTTTYQNRQQIIPGRIDGWDVDYEQDAVVASAPTIFSQIRSKVDALQLGKFYVSITPDETGYLDATVATSLDYVNMQRYGGGRYTGASDYLAAIPGLTREQLVYGIASEQPWINAADSIASAEEDHQTGGMAGIWMWRLNSDNYVYENMVALRIHNDLNPHNILQPQLNVDVTDGGWEFGGRDTEDGPIAKQFAIAPW